MTATMANDTQFYFGPMAGMVPFIEAGIGQGVGGERRGALAVAAQCPDHDARPASRNTRRSAGSGCWRPPGRRRRSSRRLSDAVAEAVKSPEVVTGLRAQGIEPASSRPQEFAVFVREQLELHKKLAEDVDLKLANRCNCSFLPMVRKVW